MNAMTPQPLSRRDRIEAGREALSGIFPDMIRARPDPESSPSGPARRADLRSWDIPDPTPEPVKAREPEPEPEEEPENPPDPKPRPETPLDERTLGNLAINTGEQALGALSDLFPSAKTDPEPDEEIADPFGPSASPAQNEPEDSGKRMLREMRLSFQSLFGLGGKSEPDHKQKLEPASVDAPEEPDVEIFKRPEDDQDLPRPSMM